MLTERGFFGGREQMELWMKSFVRGEIAKAKATQIPECPVCFQQLKPPKKIVQCLKVRENVRPSFTNKVSKKVLTLLFLIQNLFLSEIYT